MAQPLAAPPSAGAPEASQDWPGAGEGLDLIRGPKGERRICMTFDGGSTAEVAEDVLNVLKAHGIRTTLFLTGEFIHKYPDLVRRMALDGHELGNHTLNHPHFAPRMKRDPAWTKERFQQELLDADRALVQLLGRPLDPYWRPPYGERDPRTAPVGGRTGLPYCVLERRGRLPGLGHGEGIQPVPQRPGDHPAPGEAHEEADGDGLIVLMHLGSLRPYLDRPATYLGPFLDRAQAEGWHFVCIGDYLKAMGRPVWEPSRRMARIQQGAAPDSP